MNPPSKAASEAAEKLHNRMSAMKHPSGWSVHPGEFLPANVECDHAGVVGFNRVIAEEIQTAIDSALAATEGKKL
jgi:hypothetical protein